MHVNCLLSAELCMMKVFGVFLFLFFFVFFFSKRVRFFLFFTMDKGVTFVFIVQTVDYCLTNPFLL